jgi:hypothetical protein
MVEHVCNPKYLEGLDFEASLGKSWWDPISKTKTKGLVGIAQVLEHLYEVLGSILNAAKKIDIGLIFIIQVTEKY